MTLDSETSLRTIQHLLDAIELPEALQVSSFPDLQESSLKSSEGMEKTESVIPEEPSSGESERDRKNEEAGKEESGDDGVDGKADPSSLQTTENTSSGGYIFFADPFSPMQDLEEEDQDSEEEDESFLSDSPTEEGFSNDAHIAGPIETNGQSNPSSVFHLIHFVSLFSHFPSSVSMMFFHFYFPLPW